MAVGVIYKFEFIDIQHNHRERKLRGNPLVHGELKGSAVGQARQKIRHGCLGELVCMLLDITPGYGDRFGQEVRLPVPVRLQFRQLCFSLAHSAHQIRKHDKGLG
ncbi:hypothetical protein D3C75_1034110 [compost metagenome]